MSDIPAHLRRQVIMRAANRCEYCGLSQLGQEATFHIDHAIPRSAGGTTILENLALACVSCSLRKGALQTALDPIDGTMVSLFNPRVDRWVDHFRWNDLEIVALTSMGRATLAQLQLNRALIVSIRREEKLQLRHPPKNS